MTLLIACAVAVLVIVAAVAVTVLARPVLEALEPRVAELVDNLNTRIDELAKELAGAREQAEGELRRNRVLSDLGGSIDLDEVLTRTLEAAAHATESDAALVWIGNAAGPPLVATLGLTQEEAERQAIAGPPNGRRARAIGISYRYGDGEISQNGDLIRSGLAVPMPLIPEADVERYLAVFTRDEAELGDDVDRGARGARAAAGPAIENAQRFREAGSWPTSTRSPGCTTGATSTRRSRARSPARTATTATWRWSSSTSTTSRRSTTRSGTSPGTACSPDAASACATSCAQPTSRAASAATSSR